jgi:hypothetical protein
MLLRYSTFRRPFATSSTIRVNLKGVEGKKNVDSGVEKKEKQFSKLYTSSSTAFKINSDEWL